MNFYIYNNDLINLVFIKKNCKVYIQTFSVVQNILNFRTVNIVFKNWILSYGSGNKDVLTV